MNAIFLCECDMNVEGCESQSVCGVAIGPGYVLTFGFHKDEVVLLWIKVVCILCVSLGGGGIMILGEYICWLS